MAESDGKVGKSGEKWRKVIESGEIVVNSW